MGEPEMIAADAQPRDKRIGVIVVHGIGEQRRFEHVDAQVREIVRALKARTRNGQTSEVTVEVFGGGSAPFQSNQDSWALDTAPVRATVRDAGREDLQQIDFHEVWWADSNENYSFFKQLRFWGWGLVVAFIPMKYHSNFADGPHTRDPDPPGGRTFLRRLGVRARLYAVSSFAVLGAASVGLATVLAKRVLNLEAPDVVKVFVNYVAGVKLYSQKRRLGAGFPAANADFLESIDEPPRVTIRRRMIRTIARAALEDYDRWYVVAHSLGTIVAFNGLMASAYTWPGYFDEAGWQDLVDHGLAGPSAPNWDVMPGLTSPRRPVWVPDNHVAYRSAIFEKLHGVLMMGSPLEKFATLWPGRVPIATTEAFRDGTKWLSLYDPLDPVSGVLRGFDSRFPRLSPQPETIGYAADNKLLISHLRYLTWRPGGGTVADGLAEWLLTGSRRLLSPNAGPRFFHHSKHAHSSEPTPKADSSRHRRRTAGAWAWWGGAALVLAVLGGLVWPPVVHFADKAIEKVWHHVKNATDPAKVTPPTIGGARS